MEKHLDQDEDPGIDGPDYVALVIEWDAPVVDEMAGSDEVTTRIERHRLVPWIAAALGALGALALVRWGIHRYHHA